MRILFAALLLAMFALAAAARADEPAPAPDAQADAGVPEEAVQLAPQVPAEAAQNAEATAGYTPDPAATNPPLKIHGYVDVGFARAGGDGTSFSPNDTVVPADYGVDTFAPAVNSRGDVASTNSGGQFTNGFLPHSMGIGGHASAFINTIDLDVAYAPVSVPILAFVRLQALPRLSGSGDSSSIYAEQAFARFMPFASAEFALTIGKSDSVFGIEYLENEAPLRVGITPSLIARYTTGQMLGAKAFYRVQLPAIESAISLNLAATANGTMVDTLSPADSSQTGRPIFAARLGYELNLPSLEVKLGGSGSRGPRNDQPDPTVQQWLLGADARVLAGPLEARGEFVHVQQDQGGYDKLNGLGAQAIVSGFTATGGYGQLGLHVDLPWSGLRKITVYGRYGRRHAQFEGFRAITVDRITVGIRVDLWQQVAVKSEGLINRELVGAPDVDNNVWTNSLVFNW